MEYIRKHLKSSLIILLIAAIAGITLDIIPQKQINRGGSAEISLKGAVYESKMIEVIKLKRIATYNEVANVNMTIDSPGGYVDVGLEIIKAMDEIKDKGITITCFVSSAGRRPLAASMAFVIFSNCDVRYALPDAVLLTHYPAISCKGCRIDTTVAEYLAKALRKRENQLTSIIRAGFKVNNTTWEHLNNAEAYMSPREANSHSPNFLQCVNRDRRVVSCGKK